MQWLQVLSGTQSGGTKASEKKQKDSCNAAAHLLSQAGLVNIFPLLSVENVHSRCATTEWKRKADHLGVERSSRQKDISPNTKGKGGLPRVDQSLGNTEQEIPLQVWEQELWFTTVKDLNPIIRKAKTAPLVVPIRSLSVQVPLSQDLGRETEV